MIPIPLLLIALLLLAIAAALGIAARKAHHLLTPPSPLINSHYFRPSMANRHECGALIDGGTARFCHAPLAAHHLRYAVRDCIPNRHDHNCDGHAHHEVFDQQTGRMVPFQCFHTRDVADSVALEMNAAGGPDWFLTDLGTKTS